MGRVQSSPETVRGRIRHYKTMTKALASPQLKEGDLLVIANRGKSFWEVVKASEITTNLFDKPQCTKKQTLALSLIADSVVYVKSLVDVFDKVDVTEAIQRALVISSIHGVGTVEMPSGTGYLSIAKSQSAYACLEVYAGTRLTAQGRDKTALQRLPAERNVNGVLIVNKGYDLVDNYGAASELEFDNFTITDGDLSSSRALGDLFGFGHGRNIKVHDMRFGNHDQHAIDICSCSDVSIYSNISSNKAGNTGSSATIQIDAASGLGIHGLYVPQLAGTYAYPTENICIYDNDLENEISSVIQIGHAEWGNYHNIIIRDNPRLSGGFLVGSSVIELDEVRRWSNVKTLKILRNGIQGNHSDCRLINLYSDKDLSTFNDIQIEGNYGVELGDNGSYTGTNKYNTLAKAFLYVGNSAAFTDTASGRNQNFYDVHVKGNNFLLEGTSTDMLPITVFNCSGSVKDNKVGYNIATRVNKPVILIDTPRGLEASGNETFQSASGGVVGADSSALAVDKSLDFPCNAVVHHNRLAGNNIAISLKQEFNANWVSTSSNIVFSANEFIGSAPMSYHIQEAIACSDGTNGYGQIDLGGTDGWATLNVSLKLQKNTGLKKNSTKTGVNFALQYAPVASSTKFQQEVEQIQSGFSGAEWVGTQLADIDVKTGEFYIKTGNAWCSVNINGTDNTPQIRAGGGLKVWAGI